MERDRDKWDEEPIVTGGERYWLRQTKAGQPDLKQEPVVRQSERDDIKREIFVRRTQGSARFDLRVKRSAASQKRGGEQPEEAFQNTADYFVVLLEARLNLLRPISSCNGEALHSYVRVNGNWLLWQSKAERI